MVRHQSGHHTAHTQKQTYPRPCFDIISLVGIDATNGRKGEITVVTPATEAYRQMVIMMIVMMIIMIMVMTMVQVRHPKPGRNQQQHHHKQHRNRREIWYCARQRRCRAFRCYDYDDCDDGDYYYCNG